MAHLLARAGAKNGCNFKGSGPGFDSDQKKNYTDTAERDALRDSSFQLFYGSFVGLLAFGTFCL
jgi:hypothetical protein